TFESTALFTWNGMNLTSVDQPRRLLVLRTTPSLFDVLQTPPMLGAPLTDAHAVPGSDRAIVLSHSLWQDAFGGRENIVGETVRLDGEAWVVEGVMPADFVFPNQDIKAWVPFAFTDEQLSDDERGNEYSTMIARLAPGATIEQAQAQVDRIHEINRERAPAEVAAFWENAGFGGRVFDYREQLIGDMAQPLWLLQIAVALVLVIACANVANLMLARVTARRGELNVRSALGAGRRSIVGQLLTESVLLSLAGAVVGIGVAWAGLQFMIAVGLGSSNALFDVQLDFAVLAFALGLGLLTGIVFGVVPALSAAGTEPAGALKEGGRNSTGSKGARATRSGLVVVQVALAAVLLVGSGLLILSFAKLQETDPGFDPDGVLTASLSMPDRGYGTTAAVQDFHDRLLGRLEAIPGVTAAGMTNSPPFGGGNSQASYDVEGYTPPPGVNPPHGMIRQV
ncbi:MAG: ABC transporter permease, partial [Candidatus Wenzhouxiangella sp. M2_3B_020]